MYVPGAVMFNPAEVPTTLDPLDQEYVSPPVAVTLIEVVVQFNSVTPVTLVIPAIGCTTFCVIVMLAVFVQPLAVVVAVTVYVPGAVMFNPAEVPTTLDPSDQEYVSPPVAVTLIEVLVQVNSVTPAPVLLVMTAVGCTMFCVITTLAVDEQLLPSVTVTV